MSWLLRVLETAKTIQWYRSQMFEILARNNSLKNPCMYSNSKESNNWCLQNELYSAKRIHFAF